MRLLGMATNGGENSTGVVLFSRSEDFSRVVTLARLSLLVLSQDLTDNLQGCC